MVLLTFAVLTLNISNYWMRLSGIWRILQIEEGVIHYPPPLHTLSRSAEFCGCVMIACRARDKIKPCLPRSTYSRTSLIRTPNGTERSVRIREVSVWKRSLPWRHFYDSTYRFKCSVTKTGLTLVFKLHLNLIHSTKTLSFSSILHCTSQLQSETVQSLTNHCFKTKRATAQCCK